MFSCSPSCMGRMKLSSHQPPAGPRLMILIALLLPIAMASALPASVTFAIPSFFLNGLLYGQTESVVTLMLGIAFTCGAILAWKTRSYAFSIPVLGISFLATFAPFIALAWASSAWA